MISTAITIIGTENSPAVRDLFNNIQVITEHHGSKNIHLLTDRISAT